MTRNDDNPAGSKTKGQGDVKMVADKTPASRDLKRVRDGGIVMDVIHDESEIGIISCTTIWPPEAVTTIEIPLTKSVVRS